MRLLTYKECSGAEKENFLSFAADLGLARSGFIDVAQRPLNERLVFRLVRLRDESTAMHSQWMQYQAHVENSPNAKTSSKSLRRFKPTKQSGQSGILILPT